MSHWLLAAVPLAWLVPNHYLPWVSAWSDGLALALLCLAAVTARSVVALPAWWGAAVAVALASVSLQWATGVTLFRGDTIMALLYLCAFMLAVAMGTALTKGPRDASAGPLVALASGLLMCAIASVGIALVQWTGALSLGTYGADLRPGTRPFGNVAQPNHLGMLLFLGLCGLAVLYEAGRVGRAVFWLGAAFLLWGVAMSSSRASWLEFAALFAVVVALHKRTASRLHAGHALVMCMLLGLFTLAWPHANDALLLSGGRGVAVQIDGGARGPLWALMLDAIGREPWRGWGWQQVGVAQAAVAPDHPLVPHLFEHSHNLIIDLLVWAGIPVALLIMLLATAALWQQLRSLRDARALWLMAAVAGTLAYAMVEFPLDFAYFLLPFGLALGAVHSLAPAQPAFRVPVWAVRAGGGALGVVLAAVAVEYLQAEQSHRMLRLESARIGTSRIESQAPDLRLLTQLAAFQGFARTEARPGMSPAEIEQMHRVARRFAYPPVLFRDALVSGLNGDLPGARLALQRLCKMHQPERCDEAREGWRTLQQRYPVLTAVQPP